MRTEKVTLVYNKAEEGYAGDFCYCPFCDKVLFIPESLASLRPASECEHFRYVEKGEAVFANPE